MQLKKNPQGIKSLEELRRFTQNDPREAYPDRDCARWDRCLDPISPIKGSTAYYELLERNRYVGSDATILGALDQHSCDALVVPSNLSAVAASYAG